MGNKSHIQEDYVSTAFNFQKPEIMILYTWSLTVGGSEVKKKLLGTELFIVSTMDRSVSEFCSYVFYLISDWLLLSCDGFAECGLLVTLHLKTI